MTCENNNSHQNHKSPHNRCPNGCCEGSEILCISIPCPVTIVLLGITLTLELPCLRLTSEQSISGSQVASLLQVLTGLLSSIGTGATGGAGVAGAAEA